MSPYDSFKALIVIYLFLSLHLCYHLLPSQFKSPSCPWLAPPLSLLLCPVVTLSRVPSPRSSVPFYFPGF